jgi:hypothetical protein
MTARLWPSLRSMMTNKALLAPLFAAALALAPSAARANDCEVVRRARALLIQRGLDDSALRAIEPSVCAPVATPVVVVQPQPQPNPYPQPQPRPGRSPACADYRSMLAMGDVDPSRMRPDHRQWIEQMMGAACRGWSAPRESWSNGVTARDETGVMRWPSGITARDAQGNWTYPSGLTAYRGGTWYWPNGLTARDTQGNWNSPRGLRSAPGILLGEACRVSADPRFCGRAWGEPSPMDFIAFVWRARGGR